jgi:hypothetical protein
MLPEFHLRSIILVDQGDGIEEIRKMIESPMGGFLLGNTSSFGNVFVFRLSIYTRETDFQDQWSTMPATLFDLEND